jgi:hypothetical protein
MIQGCNAAVWDTPSCNTPEGYNMMNLPWHTGLWDGLVWTALYGKPGERSIFGEWPEGIPIPSTPRFNPGDKVQFQCDGDLVVGIVEQVKVEINRQRNRMNPCNVVRYNDRRYLINDRDNNGYESMVMRV